MQSALSFAEGKLSISAIMQNRRPKYLIIAGARPNFMKIAPICRAFRARSDDRFSPEVVLVHTGQHFSESMSGSFFQELELPTPNINLAVGSGSHAEQTAHIMLRFEPICSEIRPDYVIVVGDVNSTLACALVAKKLGFPVAHVEAGLRSGDMTMPEEINRLCADAISDILFTTDTLADTNLRREGIPEERIHFVGNTMIDTLNSQIGKARELPLPEGLQEGNFAVLTLHRPANVDSQASLEALLGAINRIAVRIPVVFPVHPRTEKRLKGMQFHPNLIAVGPMSYLRFLGLVARSKIVLTDSGGIQEETTVLGVPCLTMRPNTERPITCSVGTNILVGTKPERIVEQAIEILDGKSHRGGAIPEKWDGKAAERIVDVFARIAESIRTADDNFDRVSA